MIDWAHKFLFGEPRPVSQIRQIFVHTTENAFSSSAADVAAYQLREENGSYHYLVDRRDILRENTDDWLAWGTGNRGNDLGLQISFVAYAKSSREEWLAEEERFGTLSRAAGVMATWCRRYDIPPRDLSVAQLRAEARGISTHNAARLAWGYTDHTDPGAGFPMDVLLDLIRRQLAGGENGDTVSFTDDDRAKLDRIHHELTHRFESREDLANKVDEPFRDTMIGYVLEADRKLEHGKVFELDQRLAAIEAKIDSLAGGSHA